MGSRSSPAAAQPCAGPGDLRAALADRLHDCPGKIAPIAGSSRPLFVP